MRVFLMDHEAKVQSFLKVWNENSDNSEHLFLKTQNNSLSTLSFNLSEESEPRFLRMIREVNPKMMVIRPFH